jgi:hypothetical protein
MKQAYGSEPVLFSSSPITPQHKPSLRTPRKRWNKKMLAAGAILLLVLALSDWLVWGRLSHSQELPFSARVSVTFPLYQPGWLPKGYAIDQQSISTTSQVVTFTVKKGDSDALIITEQPRPSNEQMDTFYEGQLTNRKSFTISIGKVATGSFEGTLLAGISTDETWLLVREVGGLDQAQFDRIVGSFRAVR